MTDAIVAHYNYYKYSIIQALYNGIKEQKIILYIALQEPKIHNNLQLFQVTYEVQLSFCSLGQQRKRGNDGGWMHDNPKTLSSSAASC